MSLGPTTKKDDSFVPSLATKIQTSAKKISEAYFSDPIHYLLFGSLALLVIAFFLNLNISWRLILLIDVLAVVKLIQFFFFNKKE